MIVFILPLANKLKLETVILHNGKFSQILSQINILTSPFSQLRHISMVFNHFVAQHNQMVETSRYFDGWNMLLDHRSIIL